MPHQACRRAVVTIFLISILFIALLPSPAGAQVPPGEATKATTVCTPLTLFSMGQTRANNAVLSLEDGTGILQIYSAGGSVHLILDVNGYFQ